MPGTDRVTVVVAVDQEGQFYFENQLCNEAQLRQRLEIAVERSAQPVTLIVQFDNKASAGVFVRLAVSIPCYAAHNYLVSRVNAIVLDMEKAATEIANILADT